MNIHKIISQGQLSKFLFGFLIDMTLPWLGWNFSSNSSKCSGAGDRQPCRPGPGAAALSPAASGGREAAAGLSAPRAAGFGPGASLGTAGSACSAHLARVAPALAKNQGHKGTDGSFRPN